MDKPFGVQQSGLENTTFPTFEKQGGSQYVHVGTHKGTIEYIKTYETQDQAKADCADRNAQAKKMNIKARYQVIAN